MPSRPGHSRASSFSAVQIELAVLGVRDHGIRHALAADQRRQRPGIDPRKADDAARLQPLIEMTRGAIIRRVGDGCAQDDTARPRRCRHVHGLDVFVVGADIADMRKSEGDELPGIRRIGENLLITGHRGIEADFADRIAFGAEAKAFQNGAVSQHQDRGRFLIRPG